MCLRARLPARPAGTTNGVPPVFTRFLLLTFCRSGMAMTVPWWLEPEPDKPQTQTSHPHSYHRICDMLTCHAMCEFGCKSLRVRLPSSTRKELTKRTRNYLFASSHKSRIAHFRSLGPLLRTTVPRQKATNHATGFDCSGTQIPQKPLRNKVATPTSHSRLVAC
jgi:hypothetical protein